ncbi:LamG domain-containing protein, partial [Candidatus Gracilibacteria bacterium]|nr:LamG domain-containing protein [Candidatus Gracilibacteria bacterium]MCF7819838.1 LamG domain-containing protein [Candidatus Gracilibacteria bacterium]
MKSGIQGGTELVSNGTFSSDTGWTKQTCWSISGGVGTCDGSNGSTSLFYTGGMLQDGKTYILNFTITNISGTLSVFPSGGPSEWTGVYTSPGTYQQLLQKTHPSVTEWYFQATAGTTVSIDNVSVREYKARATDQTSNANHGIIQGTIDARNHGYEFDGVDDYIDVGDLPNSSISSPTGSMTWSAWVKTDGTDHYAYILSSGGQTSSRGLHLDLDPTEKPRCTYHSSSGGINIVGTTAVTIGEWTHLSCVYDSTSQQLKLYINETLNQTGNFSSSSYSDSNTNLTFGTPNNNEGNAQYAWEGNIADVRIYDRALTASEISDLTDGKDAGIPIGHWPLDRHTRDVSGNGNHGTLSYLGPYTTGPNDEENGAVMLDGIKSRVEVSSISQISSPFTLSTKIKFDNFSGWKTMIGADTDADINRGAFYFQKEGAGDITGEKFVFCLVQPNGWCAGAPDESTSHQGATSTTEVLLDTWYQVTATYDGSNVKLYVNGNLEDTKVYSGSVLNINSPILFGASYYADNMGDFIDGSMADVYIYDVALSDSQVADLYNGQSVGSPVGYWPLNGSANDSSGNGNHGELKNPVYDGALPIGDASYFDGASSIDVDSSNVKPTGSQTFSVWYKADTHFPANWMQIWGGTSFSGAANVGHAFGVTRQDLNGAIISDLHNTASTGEKRSMGWINYPGEGWHLVTSVYDRDAPRHIVYVDGEKVIDKHPGNASDWDPSYLDVGWGSVPLRLGSNNAGTGWYYSGYLRDFRVYERALSASEASRLYTLQSSGTTESKITSPSKSDLAADLKLSAASADPHENLIVNGGGPGASDWSDSDSDGKADGLIDYSSTLTYSIGSGNGFEGNYQRIEDVVGGRFQFPNLSGVSPGDRMHVTLKAKGTNGNQLQVYDADVGNYVSMGVLSDSEVKTFEYTYTVYSGSDLIFNNPGWTEIDELQVKRANRIADSSGNTRHASISGNPVYTTGPHGESSGAMTFDGNDSVSIANADWNNFTNTDNFTLSIWVKKGADPADGNVMGILGKSSTYGIDYYFPGDQIRAGIRNTPDGQYQITYNTSDDMQNWTHIVMVYKSEKSSGLRLYVNGDLKSEQTTVGLSDFSSANNLFLGSNSAALGGTPRDFIGDLADARIYSRALSGAEISALYRHSKPARINTSQNDKVTSGLVGLWSFNGSDVNESTA